MSACGLDDQMPLQWSNLDYIQISECDGTHGLYHQPCLQILRTGDSTAARAAAARERAPLQRALRCHCAAPLLFQPLGAEVGAPLTPLVAAHPTAHMNICV